jgi:hypothetical protein
MSREGGARRLVLVWLALVAATCAAWTLGVDHARTSDAVHAGTAFALAVAFAKVLFVGRDFMDLRRAPRPLLWAFQGWVVVIGLTLVVLYLRG